MNQTNWELFPTIDTKTSPALSAHNDGKIYAAAVAFNGYVAYATIDSPQTGWSTWKIIGPEPQEVGPVPFLSDPDTPPVLISNRNVLYLFARGSDNNLYKTQRNGSADWSTWQKLTSDGSVRGRISVIFTDESGTINAHAIYVSANSTVEYRRFAADWSQVGGKKSWSNALEGTIASDGSYEILVVVRTNNGQMLVEKTNKPWAGSWETVTTVRTSGGQGAILDISNVVFYARAYHVAYVIKTLADDVSGSYLYYLAHTRYQSGLKYDAYLRSIEYYTPQGDVHPQAELAVYRNKLMMAYKDHQGSLQAAYWDCADPNSPWTGRYVIASGKSTHRPALCKFNGRTDLSDNDYLKANFGNDLFAAVKGFTSNHLYFINFSRTFFSIRINKIGLAVDWCTNYSGSIGNCPNVGTLPAITETPVYSEVGFGTIALPDWLMSRIYLRTMQAGGNPTGRYYTWIHTQGIRAYFGPNLNIDYAADYLEWFEEMGHRIAGSLGICDDGHCRTANQPDPNLMSDFITDTAILDAFNLFVKRTNSAGNCLNGTGSDGQRCRGFTGIGGNYDVETRQHAWLYIPYYYVSDSEVLRRLIYEDLAAGDNLLKRKYDWIRQHIFRGVEFNKGSEPLSTFLIVSKSSGKALDIAGWDQRNGANLQQYASHSGDNQKWELRPVGDGYYQIIAMHSGKCLDVAGSSLENKANVQQYTCHTGDNQKWALIPDNYGYFEIVAKHSGKCLDVTGWSEEDRANIQQYDRHGGGNQKWKIE